MIGLINATVPSDRLKDHAIELAGQLVARSPAAIRASKRALLGGDEVACFEDVWGEADWQIGMDALLNKQVPVFGPNG